MTRRLRRRPRRKGLWSMFFTGTLFGHRRVHKHKGKWYAYHPSSTRKGYR